MPSIPGLVAARSVVKQFLTGTCQVRRGGMLIGASVPCSVLPNISSAAGVDPRDANTSNTDDAKILFLYDADVRVGDQVIDTSAMLADPWILNATDKGKTIDVYRTMIGVREATATPLEMVTFYIEQPDGTTRSIPPQEVQFIFDNRAPTDTDQGVSQVSREGTIVGGGHLRAEVGWFFARGNLPGQIIEAQPPVHNRREVRFRMQVA